MEDMKSLKEVLIESLKEILVKPLAPAETIDARTKLLSVILKDEKENKVDKDV